MEVADRGVARDQLEPLLLGESLRGGESGFEPGDPLRALAERGVAGGDLGTRRLDPRLGRLEGVSSRDKACLERGNTGLPGLDLGRQRGDLGLVAAGRKYLFARGFSQIRDLQFEPPCGHGEGGAELVLLRLHLPQRHRQAPLDTSLGKPVRTAPHRRRQRQRHKARGEQAEHEIHDRLDQRSLLHSRRFPGGRLVFCGRASAGRASPILTRNPAPPATFRHPRKIL